MNFEHSPLSLTSEVLSPLAFIDMNQIEENSENGEQYSAPFRTCRCSSKVTQHHDSPTQLSPSSPMATSDSPKNHIILCARCSLPHSQLGSPSHILPNIDTKSNWILISEMQQRVQELCKSYDKTTDNINELWERYLESGLEYRYKKPAPIRSSQMEYARFWLRDHEPDLVFRNCLAAWLDIFFTLHAYRDTLNTHHIAREVQRYLMRLAEIDALDPRLCLMLLGWDEYDLLERDEQDQLARLISRSISRVHDKVILYIFFSSFNDRLRAFAHLPERYLIAQYHMSAIQIASGMEITESKVRWVQKAAQEGYPAACCFLSVLHRKGLGPLQKDVFQEVQWLLKGASLMHDASMILLAQCFEMGKGVQRSESMAVRLVRRCIEFSRNSQAMFALSNYYRDGVVAVSGEDLDPVESEDTADSNATDDSLHSLTPPPLGLHHPHIKKSFQWCLLAASYSNAEAQMEIGFKYLRGEGCEASELRAWEWIARAALGGNVVANHFIEEREAGLMRGNV